SSRPERTRGPRNSAICLYSPRFEVTCVAAIARPGGLPELQSARPFLQAHRKSNDTSPRSHWWHHDVYDDGLYRRGEPANPGAGRNALGRSCLRDLYLIGGRIAGHGVIRELSHRDGAWHVVERLLHVFGLHRDGYPLAHRAWRCVSVGHAVCVADRD